MNLFSFRLFSIKCSFTGADTKQVDPGAARFAAKKVGGLCPPCTCMILPAFGPDLHDRGGPVADLLAGVEHQEPAGLLQVGPGPIKSLIAQ